MPGTECDPQLVADRVGEIRSRIAELSSRRVDIIAVTKTFGVDAINAAVRAGCEGIGENYAQELLSKVATGFASVPVHFIGHVQSNKVRKLAPFVDLWQTVDRSSVVTALSTHGGAGTRVLLQVNTTAEPQKGGVEPEGIDALRSEAEARGLVVEGLMTMGPTEGDLTAAEKAFVQLRRLADEQGLSVCSMGMSSDYEVAVSAGSTMVRIGSRLFGPRSPRST